MKKLFICLANSKKYGQRCIAGIEMERSPRPGYRYQICKCDDCPRWLRPISTSEYGEVDAGLVEHIALLDIVEVNVTQNVPQGYQSENVLFDNRRLRVIDDIGTPTAPLLDKLLTPNIGPLFGNTHKAVTRHEITQLDHSLMFIKPAEVGVYETEGHAGNSQLRTCFRHHGTRYDFPITDIAFLDQFEQDPDLLEDYENIYFTVSLGIAYQEQHYKLVAGVIYC